MIKQQRLPTELCSDLYFLCHQHLPPLILNATNKWNLIIGHYLGVDHAGHTFGVRTPEMMEKLSQMDDQISTLVNMLIDAANFNQEHSDTLVLVFGDHGQNLNGDHGGGTWEETESALLAFDVGSIRSMREHRRVAFPPGNLGYASDRPTCSMISELDQLDFASNLAMMLGIPIPFGNVGKISSVFWKFAFKSDNNMLLEALRINSWQVGYVHRYSFCDYVPNLVCQMYIIRRSCHSYCRAVMFCIR